MKHNKKKIKEILKENSILAKYRKGDNRIEHPAIRNWLAFGENNKSIKKIMNLIKRKP